MKNFLKNKTVKFIVKVAVSLGFIAYVILKVNWGDVLNDVKRVSLQQVILYVVILLFGMLISSYKWKILADCKKFKFSLFDYFKFYIAGTFINNFMPSFVGGDAYKSYQLGRKDRRFTEAASTVMVDRITGLAGAMMLAVFFSILNIKDVLKSNVLIIVNLLILISLFSDVLIAAMKKSEFWKRLVGKFLPEKILNLVREIYSYGNDRKIIKKAILLAMVYDIIGIALVNYVLFWSLGIHIGILDYLSVIFLTSIVASIPITINNIGIKEWSYIAFFGALGIGSAPVVTVAILSRILQMIVSFFALPVYFKKGDNLMLKNNRP
jgi:glycosyltransferase 2 family protein